MYILWALGLCSTAAVCQCNLEKYVNRDIAQLASKVTRSCLRRNVYKFWEPGRAAPYVIFRGKIPLERCKVVLRLVILVACMSRWKARLLASRRVCVIYSRGYLLPTQACRARSRARRKTSSKCIYVWVAAWILTVKSGYKAGSTKYI